MAYIVKVNLTDEEKEGGQVEVKLATKGQARKVVEALKGHKIEVIQATIKVITL